MDALDLLDWKRRIFELYAEVRFASDPQAGWRRWREVRDELYGSHPQTPVAPGARASFGGVDYFPYDPELRFLADVEEAEPLSLEIAGIAHNCGTVRFGEDPRTSALDLNCKAHDVDNLYVVDTSFFPSSSAVNPALTAMANALRVGDHLIERLGADAPEQMEEVMAS